MSLMLETRCLASESATARPICCSCALAAVPSNSLVIAEPIASSWISCGVTAKF
jgi:hypothetical protein